MFLHLLSFYDTNLMAKQCQELGQNFNAQELYKLCHDDDLRHAKTLLLLFNLSHIMILCHPGSSFDLSYLKLFHILDNIRAKIQPGFIETLANIPGVSKDWANFGRVCTPRMLFVFESPAIDLQPDDTDTGSAKVLKKCPPMRKLQMCIEDMIFRILRKTRAITNVSNNSLFSVPINQPYVYLCAKKNEINDPVDFLISQMRQNCFPTQEDPQTSQKPKPYSCCRRKQNASVPEYLPQSAPSSLPTLTSAMTAKFLVSTSPPRNQEQCFKEFIWQHVEMVFSKSVNDNVGRHGIEPIFELPSLGTWLNVANGMHSYYLIDSIDPVPSHPFSTLKNLLDISMRFSENRCNKVLPLAESAYQQDLPPFYITSYHLSRVNKAKRVFIQYARGPAFDKHMAELEASCDRFWKAGRQQCEALSLTGNLCTNKFRTGYFSSNKVHWLPTDDPTDPDDKKPVCEHSSLIRTTAACNCGRVQAEKDDPFDHKSANFDFYRELEADCCHWLEHFHFPVFSPTTPDAKAASLPSPPASAQIPLQAQESASKDSEKTDAFSTLSELSLVLSLGQLGPSAPELDPKISQIDEVREATQTQDNDFPLSDESELKNVNSRISTEEQSIKCLELPGFFPGSNFLLPWDIPVKSEPEKWPTVSETFGGGKKRQQRKLSKSNIETPETLSSIRIYLGMEYECPRGHRFFCSGPDKVIKVSSNSIVKDNASRLVQMDMPLYTPCHCKQPKGCMSQMMRVYIVTPRDAANCPSVRVQISPYIHPGPHPCPLFHPGLDSPLELQPDGNPSVKLCFKTSHATEDILRSAHLPVVTTFQDQTDKTTP
ncbi:Protein smg8 [Bulinus truncatus]|nr:Protein smg8 [Bulinus truncatus]